MVAERRWKRAAEKFYDRFMIGAIPELQSVVEACQSLLSLFQRIKFSMRTGNPGLTSDVENNLVSRVADLGGDLAPEELDDIWERAGGKRKDLKTGATPAIRWQSAVKLAQSGKLKNGLLALVNELQNTHPHNPEIRELTDIISEMKNRKL